MFVGEWAHHACKYLMMMKKMVLAVSLNNPWSPNTQLSHAHHTKQSHTSQTDDHFFPPGIILQTFPTDQLFPTDYP